MQAVRFYPPGGPEKLEYRAEPKPAAVQPGEALIKVHAVGLIHPELTWPLYQRPDGSYESHIPGHDFAGTVVAVGPGTNALPNDSNLQPGAEVYAFTSRRNHEGAMAEFAKADLDQVAPKPRGLTFEEAASVPLSALTAWQALFDHGKLEKGQTLLVLGVAGATGLWAVQFAKMAGARVLGTGSSPESKELFEKLGGDEFVDYKTTELRSAHAADFILDCVGPAAMDQAVPALKPGGMTISLVDYVWGEKAKAQGIRGEFFIVSQNKPQLLHITELLESKKIRTVVDKVYPLSQAAQAFEHAGKGHIHGKVVLAVGE